MKKFWIVSALLLAMFFFVSCGVSDDEEGESLVDDGDPSGDGGGNNGGGNDGGGENETGDGEQTDSDEEPVNGGGIYVTCTPGETLPCYEGPSGTDGVGICKAGYKECVEDGSDWSECRDQVLPSPEICSNGIDENCDGEDMTPENAEDYAEVNWWVLGAEMEMYLPCS